MSSITYNHRIAFKAISFLIIFAIAFNEISFAFERPLAKIGSETLSPKSRFENGMTSVPYTAFFDEHRARAEQLEVVTVVVPDEDGSRAKIQGEFPISAMEDDGKSPGSPENAIIPPHEESPHIKRGSVCAKILRYLLQKNGRIINSGIISVLLLSTFAAYLTAIIFIGASPFEVYGLVGLGMMGATVIFSRSDETRGIDLSLAHMLDAAARSVKMSSENEDITTRAESRLQLCSVEYLTDPGNVDLRVSAEDLPHVYSLMDRIISGDLRSADERPIKIHVRRGGVINIWEGKHRLEALKRLAVSEVPAHVVYLDDMSADNLPFKDIEKIPETALALSSVGRPVQKITVLDPLMIKKAQEESMSREVTKIQEVVGFQKVSDEDPDLWGVYAPTPVTMALNILMYIKSIDPGAKICDMGSGTGRFCFLAAAAPSLRFSSVAGIEGRESLYRESLDHKTAIGDLPGTENVELIKGDFFEEDLSGYDFLFFFFTHPAEMPIREFNRKLSKKMESSTGLRSGARFVMLGNLYDISEGTGLKGEKVRMGRHEFFVYTREEKESRGDERPQGTKTAIPTDMSEEVSGSDPAEDFKDRSAVLYCIHYVETVLSLYEGKMSAGCLRSLIGLHVSSERFARFDIMSIKKTGNTFSILFGETDSGLRYSAHYEVGSGGSVNTKVEKMEDMKPATREKDKLLSVRPDDKSELPIEALDQDIIPRATSQESGRQRSEDQSEEGFLRSIRRRWETFLLKKYHKKLQSIDNLTVNVYYFKGDEFVKVKVPLFRTNPFKYFRKTGTLILKIRHLEQRLSLSRPAQNKEERPGEKAERDDGGVTIAGMVRDRENRDRRKERGEDEMPRWQQEDDSSMKDEPGQDFFDAVITWIELKAVETRSRGSDLIIGIDTSWIPVEQLSMSGMSTLLRSIETLSRSRIAGFKDVKVCIASDPDTLVSRVWEARVGSERNEALTPLSNIVFIGEEGVLNAGSFDIFKDPLKGDGAFFAKVRLPDGFSAETDVDMLSLTASVLAGIRGKSSARVFYVDLPDAGKFPLHELGKRYKIRSETMVRA